MPEPMKWVNALSTRPSLEAAVEEVVDCVQQSLPGEANLGFVFISAAFASEYPRLMPLLQERLSVSNLIGCGGGGIVGGDLPGQSREIEGEPALSLTLAYLPGVKVETFHVSSEALPDLDSPPHRWVEAIGVPPQDSPQFILLADPFRSRVNDLLEGLDFAYAGSVKVGGLASAGYSNRGTSLFCNYHLYDEGTVGVALSGNVVLDAIVAQGCRPIGKPYRVTEGERNIILGLEESTETGDLLPSGDSQPPLKLLRELLQTLSPEDRELAQNSLFIGLVRDEFKLTLDRGDFLIRNLIGVDPRMGAIAIGDRVRPGQRIQFHLRDAQTSAEDLEVLLQKYQNSHDGTATAGALMFACLGRGEGLYGEPDFDSRLFQKHLKDVSLSGFFCNGEIGPVGGTTFLHGYTSVFGICRQP
ncbi:MAG: FIST N-terminal domain-containing protein [Geitlerinemataceae cyanobacterium]